MTILLLYKQPLQINLSEPSSSLQARRNENHTEVQKFNLCSEFDSKYQKAKLFINQNDKTISRLIKAIIMIIEASIKMV